jgi:hypothetical protein
MFPAFLRLVNTGFGQQQWIDRTTFICTNVFGRGEGMSRDEEVVYT